MSDKGWFKRQMDRVSRDIEELPIWLRRPMHQQPHREQPAPKKNNGPCIQNLVIRDIEGRKAVGLERYGTLLQPFNGRDALRDAYEEALDLCQYLRQAIEERDRS